MIYGPKHVVYFDTPGRHANEAVAGLRLAGYTVHHATNVTAFAHLVGRHGPLGSNSLAALVLDLSTEDGRASRVLDVVAADPRLRDLPKVHLIRPDQQPPGGHRVMALKRPVATPALVRLLGHSLQPDASGSISPTARTRVEATPTGPQGPVSVGDYELIDEIASGGMGTVWLAQRRNEIGFQRLHAVKLMHPHLAHDSEQHAMLLDEAALASRVHHPNVAAVVDLGIDGNRPYVVMQYVEGCSLVQLLAATKGPRPIHLLVPIMLDTLAGLQAAHDLTDDDGCPLGFIHRDVSPDNILVGLDGVARLTDFGVAKARGRLTSTQAGYRKGKLLYLAPEQLCERPDMDGRVDVFAAGVVLWHGLTGKKLFFAESPAGIMRNIIEGDIPAPSSMDARIPAALDTICMRALARDPRSRYPSAREMATALRKTGTAHGLIGAPEAVGAWVEAVHGEELRERRRVVKRARHAAPWDSLSRGSFATTSVETPGPSSTGGGDQVDDHATTSLNAQLPGMPKRQGRWRWPAAALTAFAATTALASVTVLTCGDEGTSGQPADDVIQSSAPEPAQASVVAPVPPSSDSVPTPATPSVPPTVGKPSAAPAEKAPAAKARPEAQTQPARAAMPSQSSKRPSRRGRRRASAGPQDRAPAAEPAPTKPPRPPKPAPAVKRDPIDSAPERNPYKGG